MHKPVSRAVLFVATALLTGSALCQRPKDVIVERDVTMKTRDGVTLHADIYRPAGADKLPTLLERTPYNKSDDAPSGIKGAQRGYLVVIQDVRGRYTSEGDWYPFLHEASDGFDTVEWVASLPHSNGKVGMFGGSYVGATQMLAAIAHPLHLAGICPVVTGSNYHENWTYQGGAFQQWFNQSWTSLLAQDTADRVLKNKTNSLVSSNVLPLSKYPLFNLESTPLSTRELAPYYLDWLTHRTYDTYWKQWSIEESYPSIQVPALTVGAWYDIFLGGSLRNYMGLHAHAGNATARAQQHLLVIIGGHSGSDRKVGSVDFGPTAPFDSDAVTLSWYDFLLQGKQNEFASSKPVKLFVMGTNTWRNEEAWPLQRAVSTRYLLHSAGKANSLSGDGILSPSTSADAAKSDAPDHYVYDPLQPVPTIGGPLCCDRPHLAPGPQDQRPDEARPDVLVYSTPPLPQDVEVTGPILLHLFAKSSAPDTDFTAKLVDVSPNGFAQNLTEGILRARYRTSNTEAQLITPGKIYEYTIDMNATSNVFLKGHRIRLEVSSSNFPRFDRNLNTGKDPNTDQSISTATNVVIHDQDHPSALVLPVIPR